jgi:hypothetical protein
LPSTLARFGQMAKDQGLLTGTIPPASAIYRLSPLNAARSDAGLPPVPTP